MDVRLLTRSTRKVELTPAGEHFLDSAREILAAVDQAVTEAGRVADGTLGTLGTLAIGFTGSAAYDRVPRAVPAVGNLPQRPPRGRHRRDRPEQLPLVAHHPEIADHPRPVRDRGRQVRQHPPPVMTAQGKGSAADSPDVRAVRSGSCRNSASPACDTTPAPPRLLQDRATIQ